MLKAWTIQRATVAGVIAGLGALLVSAALGGLPEALLYVYAALLAFTAFCGASILWITARDIKTRGRGGRMRPIRTFDVAAGATLLLLALYGLWLVWPDLGL